MTDAPGIGHNQPPTEEQLKHEQLAKDHADLVKAADEHIALVDQPLPTCQSTEDVIEITKRAALMEGVAKSLNSTREEVKKPFFRMSQYIDSFFNPKKLRLEDGAKKLKALIGDWQTKETKRIQDAAEAQAKIDREAASAKLNEAIEQEAQGNTAVAAQSMTEAAKLEKTAGKSERVVMQGPSVAKISVASPAGGATGGVTASIRKRWTGTVISKEHLDLQKLRLYIPDDALQTALNKYVQAGGRECLGAEIKEISETSFRRK